MPVAPEDALHRWADGAFAVRSRGPLSCQWSPRGDAHSEWQRRWDAAFTPDNGFWSGNLPTLDLGGKAQSQGAAVARVFYMAALTVISQMRTNLPIIFARAFPNGTATSTSFLTISRAFLSRVPPFTRRVICSTSRPCWSGADIFLNFFGGL